MFFCQLDYTVTREKNNEKGDIRLRKNANSPLPESLTLTGKGHHLHVNKNDMINRWINIKSVSYKKTFKIYVHVTYIYIYNQSMKNATHLRIYWKIH